MFENCVLGGVLLRADQAMNDETNLISQLRQGNESAFRDVMREYQEKVYRIVLSLVPSEDQAQDLVQDVFIEVFESIANFKADSLLATWIHRIAVHKSLDYLRSKKRLKRFAILTNLFGDNGELLFDYSDATHPGVLLEDQERSRVLFAAIEKLPEQQRVAYVLQKMNDYSMKECADLMGMSPKAVESLLSRAKSNLQKLLRTYYYS